MESTEVHTGRPGAAITGGLAGALAVTAIHEGARHALRRAPRMDVLGMRAIARGMRALGVSPPRGRALHRAALLGDVVSNTIYYALVGAGRSRSRLGRGALLGALAGAGAVALPPYLGLGAAPRGLTRRTQAMTFAWYLAGGLVAAAVTRWLERGRRA